MTTLSHTDYSAYRSILAEFPLDRVAERIYIAGYIAGIEHAQRIINAAPSEAPLPPHDASKS